jgi:hypothetical protein
MSVTIAVRFRPVDEHNNDSKTARESARERWTASLAKYPGLIGFDFKAPPGGPPEEREEALLNGPDVEPIDLTTEWESLDLANLLFDNSELFSVLNGPLAGAPTVVVRNADGSDATPST